MLHATVTAVDRYPDPSNPLRVFACQKQCSFCNVLHLVSLVASFYIFESYLALPQTSERMSRVQAIFDRWVLEYVVRHRSFGTCQHCVRL